MNENQRPRKWKMAVVSWMCIYPLLNVLLFLLTPYLKDHSQLIQTLILTLFLVPIMAVLLPKVQLYFKDWLHA